MSQYASAIHQQKGDEQVNDYTYAGTAQKSAS